MEALHISAGGRGHRIARFAATISSTLPKHLLPLPLPGGSLLGEIVHTALDSFKRVHVWVSIENGHQIAVGLDRSSALIEVDTEMTGPLGPMVRALLATQARVFACAGDFYCPFSWKAFEAFHESHRLPISILVAHSVPSKGGARFTLEGSRVASWKRVSRTNSNHHINIGCYIVDPTEEVTTLLRAMDVHKEDPFFDAFVARGLVAGYDPGILGYNVNLASVYKKLVRSMETGAITS